MHDLENDGPNCRVARCMLTSRYSILQCWDLVRNFSSSFVFSPTLWSVSHLQILHYPGVVILGSVIFKFSAPPPVMPASVVSLLCIRPTVLYESASWTRYRRHHLKHFTQDAFKTIVVCARLPVWFESQSETLATSPNLHPTVGGPSSNCVI